MSFRLDPVLEARMVGRRAEAAEEQVPEREHVGEVGAREGEGARVVQAVHLGRQQHAVQPIREAHRDVRVGDGAEDRVGRRVPDEDLRGDAEHHEGRVDDGAPQQHVEKVRAARLRHVEPIHGVVERVEAP